MENINEEDDTEQGESIGHSLAFLVLCCGCSVAFIIYLIIS